MLRELGASTAGTGDHAARGAQIATTLHEHATRLETDAAELSRFLRLDGKIRTPPNRPSLSLRAGRARLAPLRPNSRPPPEPAAGRAAPRPRDCMFPARRLPERVNRWLALALFILAAFAASAVGGFATASSVTAWYPTLVKPAWNPPSWVFAPVWSLLYLAMAVAAWRVWLVRELPGASFTLRLWFAQLGLNALWSLLFFGARSPGAALVEIVVFWLGLAVVQHRLHRLDRLAAWLWVPYLAWVTFAAWLNFTIWRLN